MLKKRYDCPNKFSPKFDLTNHKKRIHGQENSFQLCCTFIYSIMSWSPELFHLFYSFRYILFHFPGYMFFSLSKDRMWIHWRIEKIVFHFVGLMIRIFLTGRFHFSLLYIVFHLVDTIQNAFILTKLYSSQLHIRRAPMVLFWQALM